MEAPESQLQGQSSVVADTAEDDGTAVNAEEDVTQIHVSAFALSDNDAVTVKRAQLQAEIDAIVTRMNSLTETKALSPDRNVERWKRERMQPAVDPRGVSPFAQSWACSPKRGGRLPSLPPDVRGIPAHGASQKEMSHLRSAPLRDLLFAIGTGNSDQKLMDLAQQKQIELAEVLEEQRLVAARHKQVEVEFRRFSELHSARDREDLEHQRAVAHLKARLKQTQGEKLEAQRIVQNNHTRIHDLKVQLQHSRLKRSQEEEDAQANYDQLSAELKRLEETIAREESEFTMKMEVIKSRIFQLEVDIKLFDPVKFAEEEELRELETLLNQQQIETQRNEVKAKPGGYGPGQGFSTNAKSPTRKVSPVHQPSNDEGEEHQANPREPSPAEDPISSVELLLSPTHQPRLTATFSDVGTLDSRRSRTAATGEMENYLRQNKELLMQKRTESKSKLDRFLGKR